jgi:hypothetical protein
MEGMRVSLVAAALALFMGLPALVLAQGTITSVMSCRRFCTFQPDVKG